MGLIPIFPNLPEEISGRVNMLFMKVEKKEIPETAMMEFMTMMMGEMFSSIVAGRMKNTIEDGLLPLVGNRLAFYPDGFGPWVLEVTNSPQVFAFGPAKDGEGNIPGIRGDFDAIKRVFLGMEVTEGIVLLDQQRLGLVETGSDNPVPWVGELFGFIGPIFARRDVREQAVAKAKPVIDQHLSRLGC